MKQELNKLLNTNIHIIYSQTRLENLLSNNLKYRPPKLETPNVIYRFDCTCKKASYIGETGLRLQCRISSHVQQGPVNSAIIEHTEKCPHMIEQYDLFCLKNGLVKSNKFSLVKFLSSLFEIKKKCRTRKQRRWYESLLIRNHKPSLNRKDEFLPNIEL